MFPTDREEARGPALSTFLHGAAAPQAWAPTHIAGCSRAHWGPGIRAGALCQGLTPTGDPAAQGSPSGRALAGSLLGSEPQDQAGGLALEFSS